MLTERTSENAVNAKFVLPYRPGLKCLLRRGHATSCRYYQSLMYIGYAPSHTLYKNPCRIGPGLWGTSEKFGWTNFGEFHFHTLR